MIGMTIFRAVLCRIILIKRNKTCLIDRFPFSIAYTAFWHFYGSLDGPDRTDGKVRPASGLGLRADPPLIDEIAEVYIKLKIQQGRVICLLSFHPSEYDVRYPYAVD